MDRNGPCKSRGSIILWIRKEEPPYGLAGCMSISHMIMQKRYRESVSPRTRPSRADSWPWLMEYT